VISLEEDWSPLPHAYSWKSDFASQIGRHWFKLNEREKISTKHQTKKEKKHDDRTQNRFATLTQNDSNEESCV